LQNNKFEPVPENDEFQEVVGSELINIEIQHHAEGFEQWS
jgi:hypothetical protein